MAKTTTAADAENAAPDAEDAAPAADAHTGQVRVNKWEQIRRVLLTPRSSATWLAVLVIVLYLLFGFFSNGHVFFHSGNLENMALDASIGVLLAIGMTYMLGAGELDLSVGANLLLSSIIGAKVMKVAAGNNSQFATQFPHSGLGIVAGVCAALATGAAFGYINGQLVTRGRINSFIATLATTGVGTGLALVIGNGTDVANLPTSFQRGFGIAKIAGAVPIPALVAAVIAVGAWFAMRYTTLGSHTLAIGSSKEAAVRAGLAADRHLRRLFLLMGLLSGAAGLMDLSRFATTNILGHSTDALAAIAATVIGGTSLFGGVATIGGAFVGALLPVVLETGLVVLNVQSFYQQIVVGAILLIAVYLDQRRRNLRN